MIRWLVSWVSRRQREIVSVSRQAALLKDQVMKLVIQSSKNAGTFDLHPAASDPSQVIIYSI